MGLTAKSLGFVTVPTPGTAVALAGLLTGAVILRLEPRRNQTTVNVGNVYIGGSNLSKNTPTTIYAVLSPEQVEGTEISAAGAKDFLDISQYFVDADNAGDGVLVGYLV